MLSAATMSADPTITVDCLVKIYGKDVAVDCISFALKPGSVTALLGANGAGKSTTIATIMGLLTPTSGRATVLGAEMPRQRRSEEHTSELQSLRHLVCRLLL